MPLRGVVLAPGTPSPSIVCLLKTRATNAWALFEGQSPKAHTQDWKGGFAIGMARAPWRPLGGALIGYPETGPRLEGRVVLLPLAKHTGRSRGVLRPRAPHAPGKRFLNRGSGGRWFTAWV